MAFQEAHEMNSPDNELPISEYGPLRATLDEKVEKIIAKYQPFFTSIGTKLNIVEFPTDWEWKGKNLMAPKIVRTLEDGKKFVAYLASLEDNQEKELNGLEYTVDDFKCHLFNWSEVKREDDESYIELIRFLSQIREELARINFDRFEGLIFELDGLIDAKYGEYLWEYVDIESIGVLEITQEDIKEKAMKVLDVLSRLYKIKNETAKSYYKNVMSRFEKYLQNSLKVIENLANSKKNDEARRGKELLPVILELKRIYEDNYKET